MTKHDKADVNILTICDLQSTSRELCSGIESKGNKVRYQIWDRKTLQYIYICRSHTSANLLCFHAVAEKDMLRRGYVTSTLVDFVERFVLILL